MVASERQAPAADRAHLFVLRDQSSVLHSLRVARLTRWWGERRSRPDEAGLRQAREVTPRAVSAPVQHTSRASWCAAHQIGAHPVSIAYAAVQLAQHIFSD